MLSSSPARSVEPGPTAPAVTMLSPDQIDLSGLRARTVLKADGLEELAASVRECGVINPLTVRETSDGRYELICGERRLLAARELGLAEVPAVVVRASDMEARVTSLVESFQQEELNPLDKANGLLALRQALGAPSWSQVGQRLGLSLGRIGRTISLLTLPPAVIELVAAGKLDEDEIHALRAVSENERELVTNARRVAQGRRPARAVLRLVGKRRRPVAPTKPGPRAARVTRAVQRMRRVVDRALICRLDPLEQHGLINELSELASWCKTTLATLERADAQSASPT